MKKLVVIATIIVSFLMPAKALGIVRIEQMSSGALVSFGKIGNTTVFFMVIESDTPITIGKGGLFMVTTFSGDAYMMANFGDSKSKFDSEKGKHVIFLQFLGDFSYIPIEGVRTITYETEAGVTKVIGCTAKDSELIKQMYLIPNE